MDKQKYRDIIKKFLTTTQRRQEHLDYCRTILTATGEGREAFTIFGELLSKQDLRHARYSPALVELMQVHREGYPQEFLDELLLMLPEQEPADIAA